MGIPTSEFSPEQQTLWQRVNELWALSMAGGEDDIRAALHPRYAGWDMSHDLPHDREAAVRSVSAESPPLTHYRLQPHSVEVYDRRVGIVHYSYSATVQPAHAQPLAVGGRWTEIYLKQDGLWILIGVSGRPDSPVRQAETK